MSIHKDFEKVFLRSLDGPEWIQDIKNIYVDLIFDVIIDDDLETKKINLFKGVRQGDTISHNYLLGR